MKLKEKFYRLSNKTIGNEFYAISRYLMDEYKSVEKGNDFQPDKIQNVINVLQDIINSAKEFNSKEEIPKEYWID